MDAYGILLPRNKLVDANVLAHQPNYECVLFHEGDVSAGTWCRAMQPRPPTVSSPTDPALAHRPRPRPPTPPSPSPTDPALALALGPHPNRR